MAWIEDVLKNDYTLVKVLKETEDKSVLVYRHNKLCKNMVCRIFKGDGEVYKKLINISCNNLVEIYDVFEIGEKLIVLEEYIDGVTVGDILSGGLYNEEGVRKVIRDVCTGLLTLHENNIVHRDIKPENIMITNNGTVKIIDFDIARVIKYGKSADTKIIGTVGYAAPEQLGFAQSDERTDIYALGILMNVMLTGQHPQNKMYKGKLSSVIEKAVNLDPKKRYENVFKLKKNL